MQNPKIFQTVVLGVFGFFIILGLLAFSGRIPFLGGRENINYGKVIVWGTIPFNTMQQVIGDKLQNQTNITISYVQKNKDTFTADLVDALASGSGPDLFIISQDGILQNMNKIALIPYQYVSARDFKNTFVSEGEMFLQTDGIVAMPFTVDPIVMYWNRDMFTNAGIAVPPVKWSEFYSMNTRVVVRDKSGNITKSFVSFGSYSNVSHAKEVLSMLMMQAGSPVVTIKDNVLTADITSTDSQGPQGPAARAVSFFSQFSKSDKDSYSWNRSLPFSKSMFEAGDLAIYFGYASEYPEIKAKNPNLNFDVAPVPQTGDSSTKITFGRVQGLALTKYAKNPTGAIQAALLLSSKESTGEIAQTMSLPPVRRDLLVATQNDPVLSIFYDSVLIARAWQDPDPAKTDDFFENMINDVESGRQNINEALTVAEGGMSRLLSQYR
ncbi:MAG: extracellular solute-binding protein [Candidatus Pacebacteria bacterium]|nr:extracellular solute-binding protein [Candidatus Paceibacterota bacterium]